MQELIKLIEDNHLGWYREDPSLKSLTTYLTGGNAKLLVFPKDVECLQTIIIYLRDNNINYKLFGNDSNILLIDKDYDGVIIKFTKICGIDKEDTNIVVDSGYSLALLANQLSKEGLSGLEFACDILDENLELKTIYNKDLDFGYRHSILSEKNWIILKAYFKLKKSIKEEITELINERKIGRIESQSQHLIILQQDQCLEILKEIMQVTLIEEVGFKGYMYGGAGIVKSMLTL